MRVLKVVYCAAALVALLAANARGDEWDKKTYLTFSGPVQVPGATLPAGTYTFKLADLQGNRHVVQIFDKAERHIYTTILAIPNERMEPPNDPLVLFAERAAGAPQAVKAWFYPGNRIGNEFVYPKSQAMMIAKANRESVLATSETSTDRERLGNAQVGRVNESGEMTTVNESRTPAPSTTASNDVASRNSSANARIGTSGRNEARSNRASLPRTAGELPLLGLLSGLSLAGGFVTGRLRRRK